MAKNDSKKIAMVVIAAILLLGGGSYAWALYQSDNDGDGVPDLFDKDKGSGDGKGDTGTPPPNGSKAVILPPGPPNGSTTPPPLPPGTAGVQVTGLDMSSLYKSEQPISEKMYILQPGVEITETVRLRVTGTTAYKIKLTFDLLEGQVDQGLVRHASNGVVRTQETVTRDSLAPGDYSIQLKGRAPVLSPGKNWHLGRITLSVAGDPTPQVVRNWQGGDVSKAKWLALAYPDVYTDFPAGSLYTAIEPIASKDGVTLKFKMDAFGFEKEITSAVVHQVTYSGKYSVVYAGNIPACSTGEQGLTFLPNPLGLPCFFLGGTESSLFIPAVNLVSVGPNEAYFKIGALAVRGNISTTALDPALMSVAPVLMDLSKDPDDTAARVNIKGQIVGGKAWSSTSEYFSVMGAQGFFGFFSAGMASGGHPEAQWFK